MRELLRAGACPTATNQVRCMFLGARDRDRACRHATHDFLLGLSPIIVGIVLRIKYR
jgi:hypothetical protein